MDTYTFDTNCILALEQEEPASEALRAIVRAYRDGRIDLAIPAVSALENQRTGRALAAIEEFYDRLRALQLSDVPLIHAIAHYGIGFYGVGYLADASMDALERDIHQVLHPSIEYSLAAYCLNRGLAMDAARPEKKWRNAKCDVQVMWSHIFHHRSCFVSNDDNFFKAAKRCRLWQLGAGRILRPNEAAAVLPAG